MELSEVLVSLRRGWLTILLSIVIGILAATGVTMLIPPTYSSTASIMFVARGGSPDGLGATGSYIQSQLASYAEISTSAGLLDRVAQRVALPMSGADLSRQVTALVPPGTALIEITVKFDSRARAAQLANAITEELRSTVTNLTPGDIIRGEIISSAVPSERPISPSRTVNLSIGAALGLVVGIAIVLLRHTNDRRRRTVQQLATSTQAPLLGRIPGVPHRRIGRRTPSAAELDAQRTEAYRRVRANLQVSLPEAGPTAIVVTAATPGEGVTTTARHLAAHNGEAGVRVLLIDANLRDPQLSHDFSTTAEDVTHVAGLATVLGGFAPLAQVVRHSALPGVDVLLCGPRTEAPSELLGGKALEELLVAARAAYDVVIVDAAPLVPYADSLGLVGAADGVVLVVSPGIPGPSDISDTLETIEVSPAPLLGIVLTRVDPSDPIPWHHLAAQPEPIGQA
ncbi:polysaccharide biosynthesis tyrosine autokinase [Granulicoccus phenolivorans]|uniref:polysaccharide biosynthesis tyrosine autokinase n=1 Tax=Granulicoccus phenolivorans TaxID=266854 RepID=UPI000421C416|nr:polysaccharide biosynthesis tyrosine autokinase [Granulicoccus phenolivorans]